MNVFMGLRFEYEVNSVLLVVTDGERIAEFDVVEASRLGKGLTMGIVLIGGERWTLRISALGWCSLFRPTGQPLDCLGELLDRYGRLWGVGNV
jgi:hypothetical protein